MFREKDSKVVQVVEEFGKQKSQFRRPSISETLKFEIERIFLSPDVIDPESELMKSIARPNPFPRDRVGKVSISQQK